MVKETAVGKRVQISKYQKQVIIFVLVAAVVLSAGVVVSIFLGKYIAFNGKVIGEKNKSITEYETAVKNMAQLSSSVLELSQNEALESVGRMTASECYDSTGERRNFEKLYREATSTEEQEEKLKLMKKCSALRVVPDALPANRNEEALMASLDQIFKISGWEPESLSPDGATEESEIAGLSVIPVSLSVEANTETTYKVLDNIERSIRNFDINTATISWSGENLELRAQASAYYTDVASVGETEETIYATDEARKAARKK